MLHLLPVLPLCLCPAGVHGVCQGAGERGGRGRLSQHNVSVAASAAGRPRFSQPPRQHRAPALNPGREAAGLTDPDPARLQRLRVHASTRPLRDSLVGWGLTHTWD